MSPLDRPTTAEPPPSVDTHLDSTVGAVGTATTPDADAPPFGPPAGPGEVGRLGKYRVQKLLGRGGMGAVYLAFDERLQRKVALKVMLPAAAANPTAKDRFLREARSAAQIDSDFVVRIYEADEIDGVPFIALQYLQGYPLDEYLKKKGLPSIPQVLRLAREAALGLAAAHELGLVHRDIKPGNVWLEAPGGRVKILDFGLAKPVLGKEAVELTASGAVVGTPAYMAPEQGMGRKVDGRADLFSLGCMLYRLVTGRPPFDRPTLMAVLTAVATEEPTPVREVNPSVPEPLAALIRRLMAKNPADRPPTAKAVADELALIAAPPPRPSAPDAPTVPAPPVVYVPIAVSVAERPNPFADLTDDGAGNDEPTPTPVPKKPKAKPQPAGGGGKKWLLPVLFAGGGLFGLALLALAGFIVIKIVNKDGSVTEIKVPDDARIEVDGKPVKPDPKPTAAEPKPTVAEPKPPATAPKPKPPGKDADRVAAEWVLARGGNVRIASGGYDDVKKLPAEPFRIVGVILSGRFARVTDADLDLFAPLALSDLDLGGTVTDDGVAKLAAAPVGRTLVGLNLSSPDLTDAAFAAVPRFATLQTLYLHDAPKVTGKGFAHLKGAGVVGLSVSGCGVTDDALPALAAAAPKLTRLYLGGTKVTDAGLKAVGGMAALEVLGLDQLDGLTDDGLKHLAGLTELRELSVTRTPLTGTGFAALAGLTKLSRVSANTLPGLTADGCKALAALPALDFLDLTRSAVTDTGLTHLQGCKPLRELALGGTKVSADGVAAFKKARPEAMVYGDPAK